MTVVEQLARAAVHRRDHAHGADYGSCLQARETVYYGALCFVVCHHCSFETGLLSEAEARRILDAHRCSMG